MIISTAPTQRDVVDLLWTEVRLQRARALVPLPNDLQPSAPYMGTGPDHYAKGYTARDANSAQGRHRKNMLFLFDEKEGVIPVFWHGMKSMFRPGSGDAVLVAGNPHTTTTIAYQEHQHTDRDGNPTWHRIRLSSLDHPNIAAGLANLPLPVPGAVTVGQMDQWVEDWCDPVAVGDEQPTDITWRGRTYRAGPIGEPRILGLRPTAGSVSVWSKAVWDMTLGPEPPIPAQCLPVIGCDCAAQGPDYTGIHVRCGPVSLFHQQANGWDAVKIAARLLDLANEYAVWANVRRNEPRAAPFTRKDIRIQLDDDMTGRAVSAILARSGCTVRPINAATAPQRPDLYARARSELWFQTAKKAAAGLVNVSRLDRATRQRLETQALQVQYGPDLAGRREVESKDDLRKPERIGRSPDDMDALNLAYYDAGSGVLKAHQFEAPPREPTTYGRGRKE